MKYDFLVALYIYLLISGLDDLDPAAAFLAREHEQLGELEEEIGSLSGASYCCASQSFFSKNFFILVQSQWRPLLDLGRALAELAWT